MELRRSVYVLQLTAPSAIKAEVVRSELEEIKWVSPAADIELDEELVARD
jgi:hypothetical protein